MSTSLDICTECKPIIDLPSPSQAGTMQGTSQHHQVSSVEKMLSACSGALLTSLLVTPLDVVKTRLQSQAAYTSPMRPSSSPYTAGSLTQCCREVFFSTNAGAMKEELLCRWDPNVGNSGTATASIECTLSAEAYEAAELAAKRQFNGTLDGVSKIIRYEGVTSLYRGLSPALVMSVPTTIIYFVGYDYLRDHLQEQWMDKNPELVQYAPLVAGGVARTVAATIISPLELFRTRMQSVEGLHGFRGVFNSIAHMVKVNGPQALWRGLPPTLWRDVPFSAIYWMGYEQIKQQLTSHFHVRGRLNEFEIAFTSGALSGMIAATLTTPFDVTKTRRQVDIGRGPPEDMRMINLMQRIVREEGYQGLFRGLVPRLAKVAPSCAIMISSYELGKAFFARRSARTEEARMLEEIVGVELS